MKPYYEDDYATLYHGDCREVLPSLTADALVTDTPYGVDFAGKHWKKTKPTGGYLTADDPNVGPEVVRMALPLVRRGAVFTGIRQMFAYPEPADIGCVYSPAGAGFGPWGYTCFNPILYYGKAVTNTRPSSMWSTDHAQGLGHPCAKPMPWMRWLVNHVTEEGEVVLDPFAGSGTTLRAAKDLGRRAIGVEISEAYCEIAVRRLAQEVFDFGAAS